VTGGAGASSGQTERDTASGYTPPASSAREITTASVSQEEAAPAATGATGMRWPVRGRVIAGFGASSGGKTNDGIDIAVPEGTAVRAAENGVVIYAGDGLKEFGNTVLIRHDDGMVTVYGHNSRINVSRGDTVRRGQEIALSGTSGSAESPRLHFEVRKDSTPVDPMTFLE
jgi:murein DD-endopeptidase MepM/ murein hydrolase activator NlpD